MFHLWVLTLALAAPPQRIVSTAPGVTEMLFDLALGPRVAGVTTYCRYPAAARSLPKIGTFLEPDLERIAALRPDLVIIIKNPVRLAERLHLLKLNTLEVDPMSMKGVFESIEAIGRAAGVEEPARRRAAELRSSLDQLRRTAGPKRSVLFLVGRTPGTLDGLVGAGRGTYLDELLTIAGGSNVLADAPLEYPKVPLETIAMRDPEVIIDMGDAAHAEGGGGESPAAVERLWATRLPQLRAVRNHHIYAVANDMFVVPGPRMVDAARAFRRMLNGER